MRKRVLFAILILFLGVFFLTSLGYAEDIIVFGRVFNSSTYPINEGQVVLYADGVVLGSAITNFDGAYIIKALVNPQRINRLHVSYQKGLFSTREVEIPYIPGVVTYTAENIDSIWGPALAFIAGQVVDINGVPIRGATVSVKYQNIVLAKTTTIDSGLYRICVPLNKAFILGFEWGDILTVTAKKIDLNNGHLRIYSGNSSINYDSIDEIPEFASETGEARVNIVCR